MFFILLQIVDIGSGKGYLGQYLTSNYNIDVLGIEMNFGCTSSAEMMSSKMKTAHNTNIYDRYKTVTCTIEANSNDQSKNLVSIIKENFSVNLDATSFNVKVFFVCFVLYILFQIVFIY